MSTASTYGPFLGEELPVTEIGLRGVPHESLIEFEDGGTMLSRQILGEMLATNKRGVLSARVVREGRRGRPPAGEVGGVMCSEDSRDRVRGPHVDGKRARLLCQRGASSASRQSFVRSISSPARESYGVHRRGRRGGGSRYQRQRKHLRSPAGVSRRCPESRLEEGSKETSAGGSPSKRKRSPAKLYDHAHNPRVLRSLVDETVLTGIAGGGSLRGVEGKRMEELRSSLRLALYRTTELEDQVFQSQTGAPKGELLTELQLDSVDDLLSPLRIMRGSTGDHAVTRVIDVNPHQMVLSHRRRHLKHKWLPAHGFSPERDGGRASAVERDDSRDWEENTSSMRPTGLSFGLSSSGAALCDRVAGFPEARRLLPSSPGGDVESLSSVPKIATTCNAPLSPLLTPRSTLRRHLSSLRPFSADGARFAWVSADATREHGEDSRLSAACATCAARFGAASEQRNEPRWPILFVMGSWKPPEHHPLSLHSLPYLDDGIVTLLATASGESDKTVRTLIHTLARFDQGLLRTAVEELCCATVTDRMGVSSPVQVRELRAPLVDSWVKGADESLRQARAVRPRCSSTTQAQDQATLLLSESSALHALTSGFLSGVFALETVHEIVRSARPLVVSTSAKRESGMATDAARENRIDTAALPSTSIAARETSETRESSSPPEDTGGPDADKTSEQDAGHQVAVGEEGVLVTQLVRAAAARYRVFSLALRYRHGDRSVCSAWPLRGEEEACSDCGLFVGGDRSGAVCLNGTKQKRRPASAGSDELGLPPLKLLKGGTRATPVRKLVGQRGKGKTMPPSVRPSDSRVLGGAEARARVKARREGGWEHGAEEEADVDSVHRPRSTPRCLRPGFQGRVTAAQLRHELETAKAEAARLGMAMAKKAEAWKKETEAAGVGTAAAAAVARNEQNRDALARASDRARMALLDSTGEQVRQAFGTIYASIIRRSWRVWVDLTLRRRSIEVARRVMRLAGAAGIGFGIMEPLLRRRKRARLVRWAATMRAERVLEVQAAAIELQRTARGFVGRARFSRRRHDIAAVTVQRFVRGLAGRARSSRRAKFLLEVQAVKTIERHYLHVAWRRHAAEVLAAEGKEQAATRLQAVWRGLVLGRRRAGSLRRARAEAVSAVMIQRLWRGVMARGEADVLLEMQRRQAAAARIQAIARGRRTRNIYRPIFRRERAASRLCRFWFCAKARGVLRSKRCRLRLATLGNPLARGFLARLASRRLRLQRYQDQQALLLSCLMAQKLVRGRRGRLKARRELLRRCAAVELQRMLRGMRARRMSSADKRERERIATWTSALAVQRVWRGLKGRRKFGQLRAELEQAKAAFTIQSAYRRVSRRRRRREQRARARGHTPDSASAAESAPASFAASGRDGLDNSAAAAAAKTHAASPEGRSVGQIPSRTEFGGADDELRRESQDSDGGDIGDVAMAALAGARRTAGESPPTQSPLPQSLAPAELMHVPMQQRTVAEVGQQTTPALLSEECLAYHEAKLRYLQAQEAAHGASATRIQAMIRGFSARKEAAALRLAAREDEIRRGLRAGAAIAIQAVVRRRGARVKAARQRAAVLRAERVCKARLTIQCAVRCYIAKCRLWHLRVADKERLKRLQIMAARIQARVRGWQTREVWRKFFKSKALLERERQRRGAQQIQSFWRSKLAKTEIERRRSARDASLLAEELERHLKSILGQTMERERRRAYALRLQCWWRGICAVKTKARKRLALHVKHEHVDEAEEQAAVVIQCHWRAYRARRFYHDNYATLYYEQERKKYCTECQAQYATRKCDTCLDKFCEGCWIRMHGKGARRFHHWAPFAPVSYNAMGQQSALVVEETAAAVGGSRESEWSAHAHEWNPQAEGWTSGEYDNYAPGAWSQSVDGTWNSSGEVAAYDGDGYSFAEYQYPGIDYDSGQGARSYHGGWQQGEPHAWDEQWPASYDSNGYMYRPPEVVLEAQGEEPVSTLDAGSASYQEWTPEPADSNFPAAASAASACKTWEADQQEAWYTSDAGPPQARSGNAPETMSYYYSLHSESAHLPAYGTGAGLANKDDNMKGAPEWGGWGTPITDGLSTATSASRAEIDDTWTSDTRGTDRGVSTRATTEDSWSVNEFGQRVWGEWVEYFDESAQAAYFYNTSTGEASWTEPVTG